MTPYIWGGGHGSFESSGYDCSGAVSYALHGGGLLESPLDSTGLETWGEAGPGKWITVYANAEHAWMIIGGLAFDTVGGPGPRWHPARRFAGRLHRPAPARPLATSPHIGWPGLGTDLLSAGDHPRGPAGDLGAVPDLEPRARGAAAEAVRLGHPPERRLLPLVPRRHPLRDGAGALPVLPRGLEADLARLPALGQGAGDAEDNDARLAWIIIVGTIPAGILGLALEHKLRTLFASPTAAAIFLTVNGVLLLAVERFRRRPPRPGDGEGDGDARIAKMGFRQALGIGAAQALALIPGISRSGVTMGGGLLTGLSNEDAARYAFLLATPIIGAAGRPEAARALRLGRRRRPRPGAGRRDRRRPHHLGRGQVPAPVLRDQPPQPVRHLLHLRRRLLPDRLLALARSSGTTLP